MPIIMVVSFYEGTCPSVNVGRGRPAGDVLYAPARRL
jgi:hypothetical protein